MTLPWWLHRTLIIAAMVTGAFLGAILVLHMAHDLGQATFVIFPLGFILGAAMPYTVFRKWIHARCPVDGETMLMERVSLPKRYKQQIAERTTIYRCPVCGVTK